MMRFYGGLSDKDCLAMPFTRLLLLFDKIRVLQTEEEIREIVVAHTGDPQQRVIDLQEDLHATGVVRLPAASGPIESKAGFVGNLDESVFAAVRDRQRAADERNRAAHQAGDLPDPL